MKLLLEGLFVALVLELELAGVVVLGRSMVATETYPPAPLSAPTTYIATSHDDGGAYWVEWENPSCDVWRISGEGDTENFEVNRFESEVVGIGEATGCRGHLRPHTATSRQPGVGSTRRHRAAPSSESAQTR
jgi:hypothetical protein